MPQQDDLLRRFEEARLRRLQQQQAPDPLTQSYEAARQQRLSGQAPALPTEEAADEGGLLHGVGQFASGVKQMTVGEDVPSLSEMASGFGRLGRAMLNQPFQTTKEAAQLMFVDPAKATFQRAAERAEQAGFEENVQPGSEVASTGTAPFKGGVRPDTAPAAAPVLGGALETGVSAVPFVGPAALEVAETAGEGNLLKAAGQIAGLGLPIAGARAAGKVKGSKLTTLPESGIEFPLLASEKSGKVPFRGIRQFTEKVSRATIPGRARFSRFEVGRQNLLIDDLAAGVVRRVSRENVDPASAGVALQRELGTALKDLKSRAGDAMDVIETANANVSVVPVKTPGFARTVLGAMEESGGMGTVRGQRQLVNQVRSFADGKPVSFEAAAFLRKLANDSSRAVAENPLPGVSGGLAKKFAQTITEDMASSLRPDQAKAFLQSSARFRVAAKRLENKTFERIMKADPEKVPKLLEAVDIREIRRLKAVVGKQKFDRSAAALLDDIIADSVVQRDIIPTAGEGGVPVLEQQLAPNRMQTRLKKLRKGGRLDKIFSKDHAGAIEEIFTVAEVVARSQQVQTGRLIGAWIDKALVFGVPAAAVASVAGLPVSGGALVGGLAAAGTLSMAAKVMTTFKGASALRQVAQAAAANNPQRFGVAMLGLRRAIEFEHARESLQGGGQ